MFLLYRDIVSYVVPKGNHNVFTACITLTFIVINTIPQGNYISKRYILYNLKYISKMTNQEEYQILMSVKDKIKRKDIKKFISVTRVRREGIIDIINSFLTIKENVLEYNISYKLSRYSSTESDVIACGILSGNVSKLVDFFTTLCKILDEYQYYNIEIIDLKDE